MKKINYEVIRAEGDGSLNFGGDDDLKTKKFLEGYSMSEKEPNII